MQESAKSQGLAYSSMSHPLVKEDAARIEKVFADYTDFLQGILTGFVTARKRYGPNSKLDVVTKLAALISGGTELLDKIPRFPKLGTWQDVETQIRVLERANLEWVTSFQPVHNAIFVRAS
jgi:hypothetical protein